MGIWLLAAAFGSALPNSIPADATRGRALKAAQECGVKVEFVSMPEWVIKQHAELAGKYSVEVDPKATPERRKCFASKFPTTRVGFISAPPEPKKKN